MQEWIRQFLRDRRGNFAMVTGLAIAPLFLGVGLSVDATNITRRQNELQQAVDSAVLAIAREGAGLGDAKARSIAKGLLAANYDQRISDIKLRRQGTAVNLAVNSATELYFGNLLGKASWSLQASASADLAYCLSQNLIKREAARARRKIDLRDIAFDLEVEPVGARAGNLCTVLVE